MGCIRESAAYFRLRMYACFTRWHFCFGHVVLVLNFQYFLQIFPNKNSTAIPYKKTILSFFSLQEDNFEFFFEFFLDLETSICFPLIII